MEARAHGAEPLHAGWMQLARGRWNMQRPRIACLYTSYTADGALAEYDKLANGEPGYATRPRDLVSIQVDVEPVLDLGDEDVRARYGVTERQLLGAGYGSSHRVVREAVLRDGFRAIRAPSGAVEGVVNLMIYPESHAGRLRYSDGPDRLPINHGPAPLRPGA
ncbi:MAG TPA: RES family NAD+ phosphorylase [Longimicrobium sp.]|nr:RES family NAD+ phosphorylase [Longimicrobium sp.]